jgi:phosphohistidine phosphatase
MAPSRAPAAPRLIVLRHAKSAWPDDPEDPDFDDHERPLAGRGRRDAPAAGRWLREHGCVPDLVICSTARRTRETWDLVLPELGSTPLLVFDPGVYEAGWPDLLEAVREMPERRRTLLLIAHLPAVQELVVKLAGKARGDAMTRLREKFPTSGLAVLALPDTRTSTWAELAPGDAVLTDFAVPRGIRKRG